MDAVENLDTDTGDPELVRVAAEHGLPLVKLLHTLKLGSISLRGCSLYYYRLDMGWTGVHLRPFPRPTLIFSAYTD